jgi:putative tryptophan/tyrosine transport system substrate-binding protein
MRRRRFITLLAGAAAWPLAARAQAMPVIGYLGSDVQTKSTSVVRAFEQGLAEAGYVDGRNVAIEYRWSQGRLERYPELVADLVRRQVSVIAATGGIPAVVAAKAATATIPIVFQGGFDPVEIGLVASLNRPGGNVTGVTSLGLELGPKRLEVMHELIPTAKVFALIINPDHPNAASQSREMETAARALGLKLRIVPARATNEIDAAFASLAQIGADGLVIGIGQPLIYFRQLGELVGRHKVPAISITREFVDAGGLISYGSRDADSYRLIGVYTGRILKGEKPADLPVQQSTKIELIINLKAAKALGLAVPQ